MKQVVFINRYYAPDQSATARVLTGVATGLAKSGVEVAVISSRQRYTDADAQLPRQEVRDGVRIFRVASTRFGRGRIWGRALDYASFLALAGLTVLRRARRGDVVVMKTDPPMLSGFLWPAVWLRRARLVNWLQDLFPEVAQELGLVGRSAPVLAALRNLGLRRAACNIAIGASMVSELRRKQVPQHRICLIENGCDSEALKTDPAAVAALRQRWKLQGQFVVGYCGNLGRAHPHEQIADAARELAADPDITLLFVGGGYGYERLRERCQDFEGVRFEPYQEEADLGTTLSMPDVHMVALEAGLEGLIVPSKFYPVAAVGKPTLYLGAGKGDIARHLIAAKCGVVLSDFQPSALAGAIRDLRDDPEGGRRMGANAAKLARRFDRPVTLARWRSLLALLDPALVARSEPHS